MEGIYDIFGQATNKNVQQGAGHVKGVGGGADILEDRLYMYIPIYNYNNDYYSVFT